MEVNVFLILCCLALPLSQGELHVCMYQEDEGVRAIGANVTAVTEISAGESNADGADAVFKVTYSTGKSVDVASFFINEWKDPSLDELTNANDIPHMNFSQLPHSANLTRKFEWYFSFLPEDYDNLSLITIASKNSTIKVLHLSTCMSKEKLNTTGQSSYFNITSNSNGHFRDTGTCNCLNEGEKLYYTSGTEAISTVTCGYNAEWIGCQDVQCWSGPVDIEAQQVNFTVSATSPFNCSFTEGYPKSYGKVLELENATISGGYTLKSYDHGKYFSCKVLSNFTDKYPKYGVSLFQKAVVYYSPENSTLSNGSPFIEMNGSELVNYTVFANPRPDAGGVRVTVNDSSGSEASPEVFSVVYNCTIDIRHIFQFNISISSRQDYGSYSVCAATNRPVGENCVKLLIRNAAAPTTMSPDDATTFSVTTESKNPVNSALPAPVIGAIIAGAVLLILLVIAVALWRRRNTGSNKDNGKEEKVNELYGSTRDHAPYTENPESEKQEKANVLYGSASGSGMGDVVEYAMARPDDADECTDVSTTSAAEQPCTSNTAVYAQIRKTKGNVNDGYDVEVHVGKPDTCAATYSVVDKSRMRNKDNVPEVYAVVNKPVKKD